MDIKITSGIKVVVDPHFDNERSFPAEGQFLYNYHVTIENMSDDAVQLLNRHWIIADAKGFLKEVRGSGVIGEQPVIEPGESFSYSSWCAVTSEYGKMHGTYQMIRLRDEKLLEILIPEFFLCFPPQLN